VADENDRSSQVGGADERVNVFDVALQASAVTGANAAAPNACPIERAETDMPDVSTYGGPGLRRDPEPAVGYRDGTVSAAGDPQANVRCDSDGLREAIGGLLSCFARRAAGERESE
jgi:hypothetical protein